MSERRPHWDDDLLQAVYDAVFQCVDRDSGGVHEDVLPDVIAVIEDWQRQKLRSDGTQCAIRQEPQCECCYDVRELDAAIKRVRELWATCSCDRCTTNHLAILRALAVDGDSDEDGAE